MPLRQAEPTLLGPLQRRSTGVPLLVVLDGELKRPPRSNGHEGKVSSGRPGSYPALIGSQHIASTGALPRTVIPSASQVSLPLRRAVIRNPDGAAVRKPLSSKSRSPLESTSDLPEARACEILGIDIRRLLFCPVTLQRGRAFLYPRQGS